MIHAGLHSIHRTFLTLLSPGCLPLGFELLRRAGEQNTINRIHAENPTSVCVDVVEPCVD